MVELRAATSDDAHAIATVHVASWRVAFRGLLPDDVLDTLSVSHRARIWAERLTVAAPQSGTLLVVDGTAVLGFASIGPARDINDDPTAGELYAIYLDPQAWDRGHGHRLHAGVLDRLHAEGFSHAVLWVLDDNERALRFYHREGWTETGATTVRRDLGGAVPLGERQLRRSVSGARS